MARIQRQFIITIEGEQDDLEDVTEDSVEDALNSSLSFATVDSMFEARFAGEFVHKDDLDNYENGEDGE